MNLTNMDCVGQDDLCKVVSTPIGVESQTGDYREPDYIESNNFTPKDNEAYGGKSLVSYFALLKKISTLLI